jgi:hypothetical protein
MVRQLGAGPVKESTLPPANQPGVPLIVRVAGLPAEAIAPFLNANFEERLDLLEPIEAELEELRKKLVELLFRAVHEADPDRRRFLLAVKRDSFNGRSLRRHQEAPEWTGLQTLGGALADRIVALEETRATWMREFDLAYQHCRDSQRSALAGLTKHPALVRGLSLGSLVLLSNLPRLEKCPPPRWGRKEKNAAEGFLRYVSRAALKLSPFSTFTPVGLAVAADSYATAPLFLEAAGESRSFVAVRRFLLDQHSDLLLRYEPFRRLLPVVVNDTATTLDDGKIRYLRAAAWEYKTETNELESIAPALVKVRLGGQVIAWLREHLEERGTPYDSLCATLAATFPDEDVAKLRGTVDKLLQIGFLRFLLPWKSGDLNLESAFLEALEALPNSAELEPYRKCFAELVAGLENFGSTLDPATQVEACHENLREMLRRLARAVAIDPAVSFRGTQRFVHEDVFLSGTEGREVVRLARSQAEELLRHISPLARISNLDNGRCDFLHSLRAFAYETFPHRDTLPLLDLFDAAQPLFKAYVKNEVAARAHAPLKAPAFNPFRLPAIAQAENWRRHIATVMPDFLAEREGELWLDGPGLEELLEQVPAPYAAPRDFCAFVQPLDSAGQHWVLNALFEGAGRMSSRYTPAMDPLTRERWTDHYTARCRVESGQSLAELVDIYCPAGHTLNVHSPQTQRLLEIPGESSGVTADRRLRLRDLRVKLDGLGGLPRLIDADDQEVQPVHLGGLVFRHIPYLLKFLVTFGPGEFRYCIPRRPLQREHDADFTARHRSGSVVFRRRSWRVEPLALCGLVAGRGESDTLYQLNRWRRERGIPRQVFVVEPLETVSARPQTKPQFIDFGSPSFVPILLSILDLKVPHLTIVEAPSRFNSTISPSLIHRISLRRPHLAFLNPAAMRGQKGTHHEGRDPRNRGARRRAVVRLRSRVGCRWRCRR